MLRIPATTSSPWELVRKSPEGSGAPVVSLREKATPEPEVSPRLPKAIRCTLTAVPQSSGIRSSRRYDRARAPFQDSNTATIASRSCARGSCGKGSPASAMVRLKRSQSSRRRSASRSVSTLAPASARARSSPPSNSPAGSPRTTPPNICSSRLYESQAKRGSEVWRARPATASSPSPRLRTVSSIPGIETRAPERTETKSGSSGAPSRLPAARSSRPSASSTCSSSPSGGTPSRR